MAESNQTPPERDEEDAESPEPQNSTEKPSSETSPSKTLPSETSPGTAASGGPAKPARKRDARFRRQLLDKLPRLGYTSWSVKDNFKIDEEWSSIVNLQADAILGPLEKSAPERLR